MGFQIPQRAPKHQADIHAAYPEPLRNISKIVPKL
jgi:hypothetical protein